jgi:glycosyltransferase involved in cell wall biosynthesis
MPKVLLQSHEYVGTSMAGPGIRYFEFAKALSKRHEVTLVVPNEPDIAHPEFKICRSDNLKELLRGSDILITQLIHPKVALYAKLAGVKIILDAYDPMPIENLEVFKYSPKKARNKHNRHILENFRFSFYMADTIIAGSHKQRDLWMGYLMQLGKVSPTIYDEDPTLNHLIDVVPFGMPTMEPANKGEGFRSRFGISDKAHVILWGGGVWNWFDPLTLIKAIDEISKIRNDVYLVFMGIKHPNPNISEMKMSHDAVLLSKELGLFEKKVFFNFGWTTYEERQSFLKEATIGASLHFEHLETQYSFRTRILDYLWAGLPIVSTEGDYFADLIRKENLGIIVPEKDVSAVKNAILNMIEDPTKVKNIKENIRRVSPQFHWDQVVKPIDRMIERLSKQSKNTISMQDLSEIFITLKRRFV